MTTSRGASPAFHLRRALALLALGVLAAACRKNEPPLVDSPSPAPSPSTVPSVVATPAVPATIPAPPPTTTPFDAATTRVYGAPKMVRVTCPYVAPTPPSPAEKVAGCAKCKANEYCTTFHSHGGTYGGCVTNMCTKDADCPAGNMCICGPPNACWEGNCRDENDCGGRECATGMVGNSHTQASYCRTKDDTCSSNANCPAGGECVYQDKKWACRARLPIPPG